MNLANRLAMLGALLLVSFSCQTKDKPYDHAHVPGPACKDCNLKFFLNRPVRVQHLECSYEHVSERCHLTTENGEPKREILTTFDPNTGAYNFKLTTAGKEKEFMNCPNLSPNPDDKRVIEGTCIIGDSEQGPAVHFFRATVRPQEKDPTRPSIVFEFRHRPFGVGYRKPVHNGEGHGFD